MEILFAIFFKKKNEENLDFYFEEWREKKIIKEMNRKFVFFLLFFLDELNVRDRERETIYA